MKKVLVYFLVYSAVFINMTALVLYLNTKYNNIFEFDFSPKGSEVTEEESAEVKELKEQLKQEILDSLATEQDSIATAESDESHDGEKSKKGKDTTVSESNESDTELAGNQESEFEKQAKKEKAQKAYDEWKKKTAGMYENMEPAKAAKIIENYSDNIARDIIYAMNKKKAAKILAALDPEFANKITRAR